MIAGIDLGTTKSAIGIWRDRKPHIIPNTEGYYSIPSRVLVTNDGRIITGRSALRHPERYTAINHTMSSIKRAIGEKGEWECIERKIHPQEIAAFILTELKIQAESYLGEVISDAVITIPSHYDETQRQATKEAAKIAGFGAVRLLNDTSAAGLAYGLNRKGDETIMIFDLGGGTIDISIMQLGDGIYEVKYIDGDSTLGGDDFDQVIIQYIWDHIYKRCDSHQLSTFQYSVLKEAAEIAKIELSNKFSTSIYIPGFIQRGNNFEDLNVLLDRKKFEDLSKNIFYTISEMINMLEKAIKTAEKRISNLNSLLLLGGGSRIPYIQEIIRRELKFNPVGRSDNETCVAQGAAIWAGVISGATKDALLLDVVPASIGIETKGGVMTKLIEKNAIIPTRKSIIIPVVEGNKSSVDIHIIKGENRLAADNESLGHFQFNGIPHSPQKLPQIEVVIDVDAFNTMRVSVKDIATGREQIVKLTSPHGLSDSQIEDMTVRLNSWLRNPGEYRLH